MSYLHCACIAFSLMFGLAFFGTAGEPPAKKPEQPAAKKDDGDKKEAKQPEGKDDAKKVKDPTQPSETLKSVLAKSEAPPKIAVLAKVIGKGKTGTAIIKVETEELLVTKDSVIQWANGRITVTEITADAVVVEVHHGKANAKVMLLR